MGGTAIHHFVAIYGDCEKQFKFSAPDPVDPLRLEVEDVLPVDAPLLGGPIMLRSGHGLRPMDVTVNWAMLLLLCSDVPASRFHDE
jgi:hypothetical protein